MIIKTEHDPTCENIEVTIRYADRNKSVQDIIALLQSVDTQLTCYDDMEEKLINTSDIYYIESVDKKTFVYLEKNVCRTNFRLYQLAQNLSHLGFVQVSKSCILNISVLKSVKSLMNSRMEATLKNGEKIYINRKYLNGIKRALKGECQI